jgi:hypothetical protein
MPSAAIHHSSEPASSIELAGSSHAASEAKATSRTETSSRANQNQPQAESSEANDSARTEALHENASLYGNSSSTRESTSSEEGESSVDSNPIDRESAKTALGSHIQQRVSDQASLSKWNVNGEGRNQGVVHLLDYAHARPSNLSLGKKDDVKKQTGLSDEQYDALSNADRSGKRSFTRQGLTNANGDYKLSDDQIDKLESKGYLEKLPTPAQQKADDAVKKSQGELDGLVKNKSNELKNAGVKGKDLGNQLNQYKETDSNYKAKLKEVDDAKSNARNVARYTTKSDVSKKGRLDRLASADGGGKIPRGKEIEQGTRIVSGLMQNSKPLNAKTSEPSKSIKQWQATGEKSRNPDAKRPGTEVNSWKERDVPPSELKTTASADFKGDGLTVKTWGTLDDPGTNLDEHAHNLGISTVMGGESKK